MLRLLISTGEVSGDLQGSLLVKALYEEAKKRSISLELFALGGPRMKAEGAHLIADTSHIGAIGIWEVLPQIIPTFRVQSKFKKLIQESTLDGVILIDYMGPNIRIGNKLRKLDPNLPIIYYIAPQEWAWRLGDSGTTDLIGFTNKILAIFQAEADFYKERGGQVTWVGHPMIDTVRELPLREDALRHLGLKNNQKVLLILPASRSQELKYILPILLRAANKLQKIDPSLFVIIPAGLACFENTLREALKKNGVFGRVISAKDSDNLKPILFSVSELALCKSGTINMELALNGIPQVVGYRVSRITAFLARKILRFRVDHISPVNLLLNERLVPELIQEEFNVKSILKSALPLIEASEDRLKLLDGYRRLKNKLGKPGVTKRAANAILDII